MSDALHQLERSILHNQVDTTTHHQSIFDRQPRVYKFTLFCLALPGYAFIFGLPVSAILTTTLIPQQIINTNDYVGVSIILLQIAFVLLATSLSITLFQLKPALPSGRPLNPDESPKLFSLINELNQQLSNGKLQPHIHQVKISQHYEIKTIRTPRNGFPILFTNTLILGLPLLQSHSPKHLKTLISREIIQLSGTHSRISSGLNFAGSYWSQYCTALKKKTSTPNILLLFFFAWYTPLYKLISKGAVILENRHADSEVARQLGTQTLSDTLIQGFISDKFIHDVYWPHLNDKAYRHKKPPYLPYTSLERNIKSKLDDYTRQSWLDAATISTDDNYHYLSLLSRLKKLQVNTPSLPPGYKISAAQYFLPDILKTLITQMDRLWFAGSKFSWQKRYLKGQSELTELRELGIQAEQGLLSNDRIWDYIQLIKRYKTELEATELYKKILQYDTDDIRISFEIGRTLLENMNNDGIAALENTIQLDEGYTLMACQIMTRYYSRTGDNRSAQSCRRRALAHQVNTA